MRAAKKYDEEMRGVENVCSDEDGRRSNARRHKKGCIRRPPYTVELGVGSEFSEGSSFLKSLSGVPDGSDDGVMGRKGNDFG
jgi:hypothetical protein